MGDVKPQPMSASELFAFNLRFRTHNGKYGTSESVGRLLATLAERDAEIAKWTGKLDSAEAKAALNRVCEEARPGRMIDAISAATELAQFCCQETIARATSAEATCERLRGALKPFGTQHVLYVHDDESIIAWTPVIDARFAVSVGDLRRAASALTQADGEQ